MRACGELPAYAPAYANLRCAYGENTAKTRKSQCNYVKTGGAPQGAQRNALMALALRVLLRGGRGSGGGQEGVRRGSVPPPPSASSGWRIGALRPQWPL
eukprot:232493-Prorocentrum_minimum.AAC.1